MGTSISPATNSQIRRQCLSRHRRGSEGEGKGDDPSHWKSYRVRKRPPDHPSRPMRDAQRRTDPSTLGHTILERQTPRSAPCVQCRRPAATPPSHAENAMHRGRESPTLTRRIPSGACWIRSHHTGMGTKPSTQFRNFSSGSSWTYNRDGGDSNETKIGDEDDGDGRMICCDVGFSFFLFFFVHSSPWGWQINLPSSESSRGSGRPAMARQRAPRLY